MSQRLLNEKEQGKSSFAEAWWRQDRVDVIAWAAAFFWAALALLVETSALVRNSSWWDGWGVFFTGAGVLMLVQTVIRLLTPEYRRKWAVTLLFGLTLLSIGLRVWQGWGWVWSLVLIAIGVIILKQVFVHQR